MYIAPGQGLITPWGRNFDVDRNILSLRSFVSSFKKSLWSLILYIFPYKSLRDQIWPSRKIGHGQPRVTNWANLVVLEHPMMHIKVQGLRHFGSGEEDFFKFCIIYEHGGHFGHVTRTIWTNFCSPIPLKLHMKFDFDWPSGFWGEDL